MQGKAHWNTTIVTPRDVNKDNEAMDLIAIKQIFTQLSLK